jgi:hypothetical protein
MLKLACAFGSRADLSSVGHKVRFLSKGDIKKKFLSPFPDYVEPTVVKQIDGVEKTIAQKLLMYVAVARFAVSRPPQSIDFERSTHHRGFDHAAAHSIGAA